MGISLTVVVTTKNEEANIAACLDAFAPFRGELELIVVDNSSPDRTREIAAEHGATVLVQGPERCAQRNRGWREAKGAFVMFVDADMVVLAAAIEPSSWVDSRSSIFMSVWSSLSRDGSRELTVSQS